MKLVTKSVIAAAIAALSISAIAQDAGKRPGPGGPEGRRPASPVVEALDANHDGVIDASEINNASVALRTLDKNNDGQLSADEIRPQRPEGGRGPRGEGRPQRQPAE